MPNNEHIKDLILAKVYAPDADGFPSHLLAKALNITEAHLSKEIDELNEIKPGFFIQKARLWRGEIFGSS